MHHKPEIPTKIYMILLITDIVPNIVSTKLKLNIPISPQFIAPIMTRVNAILSITFIKSIPFIYCFIHIVRKRMKNIQISSKHILFVT